MITPVDPSLLVTYVDKRIDAMLGAVYLRFLLLQKPVHRRDVEGPVRQVLAVR